MKKLLFLTLICILTIGLYAAGPRSYTQLLVNDVDGGQLPNVTNGSSTTAPDYTLSAYVTIRPGEVTSTATHVASQIRIQKFGNGTTIPFVTTAFLQFSSFPSPWSAGEIIHFTITHIPTGDVGTWDLTIPDNLNTAIGFRQTVNPIPQVVAPPWAPAGFNLNVTSTPAGAAIFKDAVDTGFVTPHTFFPGEAGTYTLGVMAGYTPWTPAEYVVPALTAETTIDFQAVEENYYNYTLNVAGPAGYGVTGPTGLMPLPAVFVTTDTDMDNELLGVYTPSAAPAGFYWEPATVDVTAGMFSAAKAVAMGSRSNGTKATYNYVANIAFQLLPIPTTTYTLNVNGPDGYAVTGPVAGTTDYVATDGNDMINDLVGDYTIAAPPAGYTWAASTITVVAGDFVANAATIEFVLNEIPLVITPATEGEMPAGYPTTGPVDAAYIVTGAGIHDLFIAMNPGETGAWAYIGGMWIPGASPFWTWYNVNFDAKAPVPVVVLGPTLPVELSSFTANLTAEYFVKLTWVSESETGLLGYRVYRSSVNDVTGSMMITPVMIEATNTSTQHSYNITDTEVESGNTYWYWLESVDYNHTTMHGPVSVEVVGNVTPPLPQTSVLGNAYPNPFKANTNIAVTVKENETATITIYNILGQAVRTYTKGAGSHTINWDGRDSRNNACGSGIYFYKMSSPSLNQTKKMVIVK